MVKIVTKINHSIGFKDLELTLKGSPDRQIVVFNKI